MEPDPNRKWQLLRNILAFRKAAIDLSNRLDEYREDPSVGNRIELYAAQMKLKELI